MQVAFEILSVLFPLEWAGRQLSDAPAQLVMAALWVFAAGFVIGRSASAKRRATEREAELEAQVARLTAIKSDYDRLMEGVLKDAATMRNWVRQYDAQQLRAIWRSYRDCDWGGAPSDVRLDMNLIMNTLPKVFLEEYRRIVGEEPEGWR